MRRNRCEGCKVLVTDPMGCELGYNMMSEKYTNGRVDFYSLEVCPKPTSFRHAKQLLAERKKG